METRKALILGTNYKDEKPTLFVCYFWDGSEFIAFHCSKCYKTIAGAKKALTKLGYNEIVVE